MASIPTPSATLCCIKHFSPCPTHFHILSFHIMPKICLEAVKRDEVRQAQGKVNKHAVAPNIYSAPQSMPFQLNASLQLLGAVESSWHQCQEVAKACGCRIFLRDEWLINVLEDPTGKGYKNLFQKWKQLEQLFKGQQFPEGHRMSIFSVGIISSISPRLE